MPVELDSLLTGYCRTVARLRDDRLQAKVIKPSSSYTSVQVRADTIRALRFMYLFLVYIPPSRVKTSERSTGFASLVHGQICSDDRGIEPGILRTSSRVCDR